MRKFLFLMAAACMMACSNENEKTDGTTGKVMTSINFGGDVDFSEQPLTRVTNGGNTYVAVQIDSFRYNPYYGDTLYYRITEGVFEYTQGLQVTLQRGSTYMVRAAVILDGTDKMYIHDEKIQWPLARRGASVPISNEFTKTYDVEVEDAQYFSVCDPRGNGMDSKHPQLSYYVGRKIVKGGEDITLNMARKNAGIRFCITPPKEGRLQVYSYTAPRFIYELTPDSAKVDELKMYALPYNATTMQAKFTILYTDGNGKMYDYSVERTLKNKTITTLNVDIKTEATPNPDAPNEGAETNAITITYDGGVSYGETIEVG